MDLQQIFFSEQSRSYTKLVVEWVEQDPKKFQQLFSLLLSDEWLIVQRTAIPICEIASRHPQLMHDHFSELINKMKKPGVHDAVKRNAAKLLSLVPIPEEHEGEIMDWCFKTIEDPEEPVAVKAFSLSILGNLSEKYPDIIPEIKLLIEEQLPGARPGFKARAKMVLKQMNK